MPCFSADVCHNGAIQSVSRASQGVRGRPPRQYVPPTNQAHLGAILASKRRTGCTRHAAHEEKQEQR
eukprot:1158916-Pelagomonas_calceolata.AAC.20